MNRPSTPIGEVIRHLRHQRRLKLVAVSRHISPSTLNAIENGRMIPSVGLIDAITEAFNLAPGDLDLELLESVRDMSQRAALVDRLMRNQRVPPLQLQSVLRSLVNQADQSRRHKMQARLLLAQHIGRRGAYKRAVLLLEYLLRSDPPPQGSLRLDILSTLGRLYLRLDNPQDALGPLLEAVRLTPTNGAWESAMCNLGLAWWLLGQYEQAESQWHEAVDRVQTPERLAHAEFGLGNVAFRLNKLSDAAQAYRYALALYRSEQSSATIQLSVLNNLLVCLVRLNDWPAAEEIRASGDALVDDSPPVSRGEWLATKAEWAWAMGRVDEAQRWIREAKKSLGSALVVSWFTVRLLELKIIGYDATIFAEIDQQIRQLADRKLATGLHIALMQTALQIGRPDEVPQRLQTLASLFPLIG